MYNILKHKQAIAENIQKAFGDTPEDIEKAKWQIGEIRTDSRGIAHECYEYTADGKPRLRRVKKNKGASTTSTDDNGGKKQVDKPEQKTEDLFKVGELKNGFKFKKNTEYVLRYNKYEKQYEVFENKTQRGAGKVPMWVCKSDNGDEKFGEKILKVVQKNYAKEGSTISFGNKIYPLSLNDKKEDNKKKFTESSFKNSFDSIISNISSIVDKVFVEKPVGRDASTVDKTYKTLDWKKGVHTVGNDFYGKDELLQLDVNKKGGGIETIQLRKPISNGMGSSYNNQPIGHVIVEVYVDDNWVNFDMTKENSRKDFAELLNKNIKK